MMQKPTKPCYACRGVVWWQLPGDGWNCARCHPNPNPDSKTDSSTVEKYSPEVLALRDRVKKGNDVLFKAWLQIRELTGEEREEQLDRWNKAQKRLQLLCWELKHYYSDCLYLDEDGKKTKRCLDEPNGWWCQVCPSNRAWWGEELMSL